MQRIMSRAKVVGKQLKAGEVALASADIRRWMNSTVDSIGFRRDFRTSSDRCPPAEVDLRAVKLDDDWADRVFDSSGLKERDRQFLDRRRAIWDAGFRNAYTAVDPDGVPTAFSFFIHHEQNDKMADYFGPLFQNTGPDTMLAEGAWVPPEFRGRGVWGEGFRLLSEAAHDDADSGVNFAVCYAEAGNYGAAMGVYDAGYEIFQKRTETWSLGRRSVTFEPANKRTFGTLSARLEDGSPGDGADQHRR